MYQFWSGSCSVQELLCLGNTAQRSCNVLLHPSRVDYELLEFGKYSSTNEVTSGYMDGETRD